MATWNPLTLTAKGRALLTKVQAGKTITFTDVRLGDGVITSLDAIENMTDLVSTKQSLGIASGAVNENDDSLYTITSIIANSVLQNGYYMREIGIYAQDPDEGEILYMASYADAPDFLPARDSGTTIVTEFTLNIAISGDISVVVEFSSDLINMTAIRQYVASQLSGITTSNAQYEQDIAKLKKDQATLTNTVQSNNQTVNDLKSSIEDAEDSADEAKQAVTDLKAVVDTKFDEAYVQDGKLILEANGEVKAELEGFAGTGGGSGSSENNAVITAQNTTGWLSKTLSKGQACQLRFTWSSLEDEISTGNGQLVVMVNSNIVRTTSIAQGSVVQDVTEYLGTGTNTVRLTITDTYGNVKKFNFTITLVEVSIKSDFDYKQIFADIIAFTYTPVGAMDKTIHLLVDGTEIYTTTVSASGRKQSYNIPKQLHGAHSIEVYFTGIIDSQDVESNHLYYEIVCIEDGETTPIIASNFNTSTCEQFDSLDITYRVYDPSNLPASITLMANDAVLNTLSVYRTEQELVYRADDNGALAIKIICGDVTKTINVTVTEKTLHHQAETENLQLYLSSYGRDNGEATPGKWTYGDISAKFSNFSWSSDGWLLDDDKIRALRLTGNAKLTIPLNVFEEDFRANGKTIEFEFSTTNVYNEFATIISCMSGNRGIEITPNKATLKSAQAEISTQFKQDEHVRISFVVERRTENRLIYCYINGIMSGVVQYDEGDDFSQTDPVGITINGEQCTTNIYSIRIYNTSLDRHKILANWIADNQDATARTDEDEKNNIFNDDNSSIDIDKLPSYLPYMVLEAEVLPQYKGDKRTCDGYYVNPNNPSYNFTFTGANIDVQGTSSQYYARKNYKLKFGDDCVLTVNGTKATKYSFKDGAMPVKTFCLKADVASSEGCNNVVLVQLYNDICPYKTEPQTETAEGGRNEKGNIRQGIDGFPIVVFQKNGDDITFLGKYNFNNDKSTSEVYGFQEGDESWETLDNTLALTQFKTIPGLESDEDIAKWKAAFEGRYPEDNVDFAKLREFALWINSCDTTAATGEALEEAVTLTLPVYTAQSADTGLTLNKTQKEVEYTEDTAEYRLAKFYTELKDHASVNDFVFYYVYTEAFLMIDSRVKNSFPTGYSTKPWCLLPYDMDTAIGINNEGTLTFDYDLEDIDHLASGADIYNGQQSVLWNNMRLAFATEIENMYKTLRSGDLTYEKVEARFEAHQAYWSAAIFNEDAYFKYIQPTVETNESYLNMCQGSKEEQRKRWLFGRFRYLDSKYNTGDAQSNYINFRAHANSDFDVTPLENIYLRVQCGSIAQKVRATRGVVQHFTLEREDANDTETMIFSCDQLKSVGDLSGFKPGYCNIAKATKLEELILGCDTENLNMTNLVFGNNTMLKKVDVRNCPNLTMTVDLSGCSSLEEVYFEGSDITGINLPNGNSIRTLHLPGTVTNLTVKNQNAITDFSMPSYENITTLVLENTGSAIPVFDILNAMPAASRVRMTGFKFVADSMADITSFFDTLDTMRGIDDNGDNTYKAQVSGTIYVETVISDVLTQIAAYGYNNITVEYKYNIETMTDEEKATLTNSEIDYIIRSGYAKKLFSVGDQITYHLTDTRNDYEWKMPMDIVDFGPGYDKDGNLVHEECPIVCAHYTLPVGNLQFDHPEALYCTKEVLTAGNVYKITNGLTSARWGLSANTSYNFTPDEDIPIGTKLSISSARVYFWLPNATTSYKNLALSQGSTGVQLFMIGNYDEANYSEAADYGYNRFIYSSLFKYLNTDKLKTKWFEASHEWDIPSEYADTLDGFLTGFRSDELSIVGYSKIKTARNTTNAGGGYDETLCRIYIPSNANLYYTNGIDEDPNWQYWKDVCNNDKTVTGDKRKIYALNSKSSAQNVWSRSCNNSSVNNEYFVTTSGSLSNGDAGYTKVVLPAWVLI